jgi:hypothetical protein
MKWNQGQTVPESQPATVPNPKECKRCTKARNDSRPTGVQLAQGALSASTQLKIQTLFQAFKPSNAVTKSMKLQEEKMHAKKLKSSATAEAAAKWTLQPEHG